MPNPSVTTSTPSETSSAGSVVRSNVMVRSHPGVGADPVLGEDGQRLLQPAPLLRFRVAGELFAAHVVPPRPASSESKRWCRPSSAMAQPLLCHDRIRSQNPDVSRILERRVPVVGHDADDGTQSLSIADGFDLVEHCPIRRGANVVEAQQVSSDHRRVHPQIRHINVLRKR